MRVLKLTLALALAMPNMTTGQSINTDCTLIDGVLPEQCKQPNAGTVVAMPAGENTELEEFSGGLGDEGFSISIDAVEPGAAPVLLEGNATRINERRRVDRLLTDANVQVRMDGLTLDQTLAVSTSDLRTTYRAGDSVNFRVATNYPAYINRAEIRIAEARNPARIIAVVPVAPNGSVNWTMPGDGVTDMVYSARVYDARGRYDETQSLSLARSTRILPGPELDGPVIAAGETEDMTRRRSIPVSGGSITVFSDGLTPGGDVTVMGERVVVDQNGAFVVQRILPVGEQTVRVGIGQKVIERSVEVPNDDWFYLATVDVTIGREDGETYEIGRVAGFAKGRTASGWKLTAAVDTGEDDLDLIFRDLGAREPLNLVRSIRDEDVFLTFGDDSTFVEEAPTSGKIFLKAERNGSHLLIGDFKLAEERLTLVRSDRTLFGAQVVYQTDQNLTAEGRPRFRFSGYVASPDRLVERDVFEATGGTNYFLRRQGLLSGTSTVYIQYVDPITNRIVRQEALVEGRDYRLNHFQGVVTLARPLSPFAGDSLLNDNTLGRYETRLVVQYEYVPTLENVDGESYGLRAEAWLNDNVRVGFSAQNESTGIADNKLYGADLLLRKSDLTYLNLEVAESEGPGFGFNSSFNGGFDFDTVTSVGAVGTKALAYSLDARADLAELTDGRMIGSLSAYYDYKEAGFVSADYEIANTQTAYGVAANVEINERASVTFEHDHFDDDTGKERDDTRVSLAYRINPEWTTELVLLHTDRTDPLALPGLNGSRTDAAVRVTYEPNEDFKVWVFGEATLDSDGTLEDRDRIGVGARKRVSDKLTLEGEISDGNLGTGGYAAVTYAKDASTQYYLGYRLDPERRLSNTAFTGSDGGTWVVGASSQINDQVRVRAENTYDLQGDRPSLASTYGVTYTPNNLWVLDGGIIYGERDDPVGGNLERTGLSFGAHYTNGDRLRGGLTVQYQREKNDLFPAQNRKTWGASGYLRYQATDEFRLLANIDAIISDSDQTSFRDGRYIEGKVGFAYRPVDNDRFNALFSYTYLEDLPGTDQVNLEGDLNGPRQKSHILNADVSYDLNRQFTLGAKYGYRKAEVETVRGSGNFNSNTAHLGILRLDYHVVHNWDIIAEARVMKFKETDVTETGALLGAWRHIGNNAKVGVGYQFGDVDDDLRRIEGRKEGFFINVIAKF
ncbi:hypothetical protein [Sulfitobacter aestuariivivens]|uniref:Uncharacterized protein n=1 Tax=Sulfitobacter aestuariivivens TaxID=2766981 RepID=A0A927D817_9RHOB|nr:hypothetical protein [Sulfitobacter aestuariivivens]MBD3666126.1 hypothetical protein [Sulfitobacter aestuariivivens]